MLPFGSIPVVFQGKNEWTILNSLTLHWISSNTNSNTRRYRNMGRSIPEIFPTDSTFTKLLCTFTTHYTLFLHNIHLSFYNRDSSNFFNSCIQKSRDFIQINKHYSYFTFQIIPFHTKREMSRIPGFQLYTTYVKVFESIIFKYFWIVQQRW